jgi:uncharacterized membrane protein YphA (DoxX/SURF4 family)
MTTLAIACQIIVALGIFNVWLVRRDRPTAYRPEGASNIEEEFRRYGLPGWAWVVVGVVKVSLAVLLLVGVFVPSVAPIAGGAMALMMVSAIAAHIRVNDPPVKSLPAFLMLLLSTVVVVAYTI